MQQPEKDNTAHSVGLASGAPSIGQNSTVGVSVENTLEESLKWYVLRATYGRQQKAYDAITAEGVRCYMPVRRVVKEIQGKKKKVTEPLVPNLLFAYATAEQINAFVKDSPSMQFVSFYYDHFHTNAYGKNPPLTVGDAEMHNFIRLTSIDNEHICIVPQERVHFKRGEKVRIVAGEFEGIVGKVARVAGQQRVVVELKGICFAATAYIPSAFIETYDADINS